MGGTAITTLGGVPGLVASTAGLVATNTAVAELAALGTVGVVSGAGSIASAMTLVEVASIAVAAPFLACPLIP